MAELHPSIPGIEVWSSCNQPADAPAGLQVDVWALGISAIEMAELTPPNWAVHPLRVIFKVWHSLTWPISLVRP